MMHNTILPRMGRGTARSAVEGTLHLAPRFGRVPSPILRIVPLPVQGRIG